MIQPVLKYSKSAWIDERQQWWMISNHGVTRAELTEVKLTIINELYSIDISILKIKNYPLLPLKVKWRERWIENYLEI